MNKKTWLWILIPVLVILLVVGGYFLFYKKTTNKTTTPTTVNPTPTTTTDQVKAVTDPGVTWVPISKIDDLELVTVSTSENPNNITKVDGYYKIADIEGGGELILADTEGEMGGHYFLRFKKDATGKYIYISSQSTFKDYTTVAKFLVKGIKFDANLAYQSLSAPDFLTVKGNTLHKVNNYGFFSDLTAPLEVGLTEYGKLYHAVLNPDDIEVGGITYDIKLADSTYQSYTVKPGFVSDDEVASITWSDGSANKAKFTAEGYVKCGVIGSDNAILNLDNITSRIQEAGKTKNGEKIYTVGKDDPVMTAAYENYKTGRESDILSLDTFVSKKPVFVWKDAFGDYIIFTGRDFAGLSECGKPVIYLYPEKDTNVTVKVGAEITKSEPTYDNGWQALAKPNGELTVAGKIYQYLFWEGLGQEYPNITSGTVVAKSQVASTIKSQLGELGLNTKETADFMDFWLPKMPKTDYVRLTWLGTAQMNKLAPLSVTPAPDTMIRVFLDFAGLNTPISLPAQKLSSVQRKGFTLVEWGGLLKK